jgi:hypothetical protein
LELNRVPSFRKRLPWLQVSSANLLCKEHLPSYFIVVLGSLVMFQRAAPLHEGIRWDNRAEKFGRLSENLLK